MASSLVRSAGRRQDSAAIAGTPGGRFRDRRAGVSALCVPCGKRRRPGSWRSTCAVFRMAIAIRSFGSRFGRFQENANGRESSSFSRFRPAGCRAEADMHSSPTRLIFDALWSLLSGGAGSPTWKPDFPCTSLADSRQWPEQGSQSASRSALPVARFLAIVCIISSVRDRLL